MRNERLARAMADAGLTQHQLARKVDTHPKTVERWINQGRAPWPHRQHAVAEVLGVTPRDLWSEPDRERPELIEMFPHRASVPRETWFGLLDQATEHVDVLAWAATFFHQTQPRIADRLARASRRGATVRLCFGNPSSTEVATREVEEPLLGPGVLASKIRVSLGYYRGLVDVDGVEVRLHRSVVYASVFRYDDEMIVNPHVFGRPASENPALHLRRGTTFDAYAAGFDAVWERSAPWKGEEV